MSSKVNILVAYPYMKPDLVNCLKDNENQIQFLLDSGAFTAWKAGKEIKLDDYCKFIETMPFAPWRYFTLDVIGNPEQTLNNYEIMIQRGLKPIPIFTRGEDVSILNHYYETSDVVGIGGLVGTKGNKGFVKGIMEKVGDRDVHWLGFTNLNFLRHYKPYSCDSSTWEMSARFAQMDLYIGNSKFIKINKKVFVEKPNITLQKYILDYGEDIFKLSKNKLWGGGDSIIRNLGAKSFIRTMIDVDKHLGTRYFCALTTKMALNLILKSFKYFKETK